MSSVQIWDHAKTIYGQCNGHIWPSSTSRVVRTLKFSTLSQIFGRDMLMSCLFLGPFQDHAGTILGLVLLPHQLEL